MTSGMTRTLTSALCAIVLFAAGAALAEDAISDGDWAFYTSRGLLKDDQRDGVNCLLRGKQAQLHAIVGAALADKDNREKEDAAIKFMVRVVMLYRMEKGQGKPAYCGSV